MKAIGHIFSLLAVVVIALSLLPGCEPQEADGSKSLTARRHCSRCRKEQRHEAKPGEDIDLCEGCNKRDRESMAGLELTDEQEAQMKTIWAEAKEQAEAAEGEDAKLAIKQAAREKIHNEVFTDEQRKTLEEIKAARRARKGHCGCGGKGMMFGKLDMTAEQKAQMETIRAEAHEKMRAAETKEAKMEIMKAAHKTMYDEVFTDEQRKKLEEMKAAHSGHCGGDKPADESATKPCHKSE
jgi:Spy/CpxP family protein refolding chaperone